eukprot:2192714-Amphidinium_carterae.1
MLLKVQALEKGEQQDQQSLSKASPKECCVSYQAVQRQRSASRRKSKVCDSRKMSRRTRIERERESVAPELSAGLAFSHVADFVTWCALWRFQARKREKERLAEELRLQAEMSSKEAV